MGSHALNAACIAAIVLIHVIVERQMVQTNKHSKKKIMIKKGRLKISSNISKKKELRKKEANYKEKLNRVKYVRL